MGKVAFLIQQKDLLETLVSGLAQSEFEPCILDSENLMSLQTLYQPDIDALVTTSSLSGLPDEVYQELLGNLSRRFLIFQIPDGSLKAVSAAVCKEMDSYDATTDSLFQVLPNVDAPSLCAHLRASGLGSKSTKVDLRKNIPILDLDIASQALKSNRGLCVLTIDASAFRDIETEYGSDVYDRIKILFRQILLEMWGLPGCFRSDDKLTKRTAHGHVYDVLLNRSRRTGALPMPGELEKVARRLNRRIMKALWEEVSLSGNERRIPDCLNRVPMVSVGFSSVMENPCINAEELLDNVFIRSARSAAVQKDRLENLQRELIFALIDNQTMLNANFQAVFHLPNITKAMVDQTHESSSIQPLQHVLYGFESLIRVNEDAFKNLRNKEEIVIESSHLRPDVLFGMAKDSNVTLELDQACLRHAAREGEDLPGHLLVNILPRNLYFFDGLQDIFDGRSDLMFEVSESESINNFELMMQVRQDLRRKNISVAADDFGRGFAGLERVLKIEPDVIKFDRSLIENIDRDEIKQNYVRGLIEAAKLLNSLVLAEGVERWGEAKALQDLGVDLIQGYLLHRPQSASIINRQLEHVPTALPSVKPVA